ncbi:SIR2 family protein [Pseudochrobactrum sp. XF203]|uniref:SIR2 family protein n=1 Tax=Pseudochrobactrum sp. XF203 TaxID=2879116 RepID=UPI001CE3A0A8|nr:SIR2 family protein [Pseudochrobactrum sp. XF203]UCA45432.1 SIR2 family protein [Pseudochrobactrum sp. XF203]
MPIKTISAAQFATAFDLRPNLVAWFLGAGASAASGIPTGYAMIRDFKAQIFCRETNLSKREIDTADPIWIDRIDAFFRQNSLLPPDGDPTEYAKAFEAVYPEARHRRQYIDDAISKGTPCFGHKVLGSLMAAGKVDSVFTTNFDPLIEESAHSANAILPIDGQNRPTVAAIDSADRAMRCLNESDWPLVAKLHGDYQSIAIKNTGSELEKQDARMRHVLVESGKRFGMIFVGYSGRDASIMEALNTVLDAPSPFPNGVYWLTSSASRLLPAVIEFLERAGAAGVDVAVVECATFDELAADIIKVTDLPKPLLDRVMKGRPTPRLVPVQIPNAKARAFPVLRYSVILLQSMPTAARRIRLSQPITSAEVRETFKAKGCRATAAALGRELAVFGRDQEILDALAPLGPSLAGTIDLDPVADSWAMGLLYDTLVRSLARQRPLIPRYRRSGHSLVVATPRDGDDPDRTRRQQQTLSRLRDAYGTSLFGTVPKLGFPFQEGVHLKLEQVDGKWWCGFEPYTFVQLPRQDTSQTDGEEGLVAEEAPAEMGMRAERRGDPAGDWRRERWAPRYNRNWASIIGAWAHLLTETGGTTRSAFGLEDGTGIDAVFKVSPVTGFSRPSHHHPYFDRSK